jgi:MFS family permease
MGKLLVLFVTAFVDMVGLVMVLPLLPYYATRFAASAFMVGVLVSAFSIAQLLSAPTWGRLSDRRGRRPMIIAGLWVSATAYVVFAYADSIVLLLVSRVVQGIGGGTIGVVQAYVADASDPKDRAKGLGWLSVATSLGAVVGPALGSLLARLWGQAAPGLAAAILCLLVSGFAWLYLVEPRQLRTPSFTGLATLKTPRSVRAAMWHVVSRADEPAPRLIWIYAIAIGAFYGTVPTFPLLAAERMHITEQSIGYFVMYLGGMGVVVRAALLGRMVDLLGEARLSRLGVLCLAAGLGLLAFARSYPILMLSLTLMPLGTAFIFPCVTGRLSRVVASNERGLFLGVQQTFGGVSRVVFPVGSGLLMDGFGRGVPFWVSGVLLLAVLPLTGAMDDRPEARAAGPA